MKSVTKLCRSTKVQYRNLPCGGASLRKNPTPTGPRNHRVRDARPRERRTEHAHELAALLKDTPCKINLIPWNPFPGAPYGRSSNSRIDRFSKVLMEYGFTTIVRKTRGDDIDAACGQLAGDVIDRTKRTLRKRMQGETIAVKAV